MPLSEACGKTRAIILRRSVAVLIQVSKRGHVGNTLPLKPSESGLQSGMSRLCSCKSNMARRWANSSEKVRGRLWCRSCQSNWWDEFGALKDRIYVVQTNSKVVERCMLMTTDPGDLVIDPTCGFRNNGIRSRAMGKAMDHYRHQPRCNCSRSSAIAHREVRLLRSQATERAGRWVDSDA